VAKTSPLSPRNAPPVVDINDFSDVPPSSGSDRNEIFFKNEGRVSLADDPLSLYFTSRLASPLPTDPFCLTFIRGSGPSPFEFLLPLFLPSSLSRTFSSFFHDEQLSDPLPSFFAWRMAEIDLFSFPGHRSHLPLLLFCDAYVISNPAGSLESLPPRPCAVPLR